MTNAVNFGTFKSQHPSEKQFFIYPHKSACVIWFALVLDAVKAVSPLAVVSFVVVVELDLPDGLKKAFLRKLLGGEMTLQDHLLF